MNGDKASLRQIQSPALLAELLLDPGEIEQAHAELQIVLNAALDPVFESPTAAGEETDEEFDSRIRRRGVVVTNALASGGAECFIEREPVLMTKARRAECVSHPRAATLRSSGAAKNSYRALCL